MPTIPDWGFIGPCYQERSPVFDAQNSLNLFPVLGLATSKSKMALYGRPGFSTAGLTTNGVTGASPIRAMWAGDDTLFIVDGDRIDQLDPDGSVHTFYGSTGGSGTPCTFVSNNQQLLLCDPSASMITWLNPIGSNTPVFNGLALEYLDGFMIAIATGASLVGANPNQINISNFLDAGTTGSWDPLNYTLRTGASDLTTQLAVLNDQLWIFGQKTTEVWYNAGNPLFPFARISGATINVGLASPYSVVKFKDRIMWIGADDKGYVTVYENQGLVPVPVSTSPIDYLLGMDASALPFISAFGYEEDGHIFYQIVPRTNSYAVGHTHYVYDLTMKLWHLRTYIGTVPAVAASVPGFNATGPIFFGDGAAAKIGFQGLSFPSDLGQPITYQRTAPHTSNSDRWLRHNSLVIDADVGTAEIALSYSNDGGRTFPVNKTAIPASISGAASVTGGSTAVTATTGSFLTFQPGDGITLDGILFQVASVTDATHLVLSVGFTGSTGTVAWSSTRGRFKWWQLGQSRDRVYRATITDAKNQIRLIDAYLNVDPGTEP